MAFKAHGMAIGALARGASALSAGGIITGRTNRTLQRRRWAGDPKRNSV